MKDHLAYDDLFLMHVAASVYRIEGFFFFGLFKSQNVRAIIAFNNLEIRCLRVSAWIEHGDIGDICKAKLQHDLSYIEKELLYA